MDIEKLREELTRLVKGHDWSYERSDDRGVYVAGRAAAARIAHLVKTLPDGVAIHNANAPAYYHLPVQS